MSRFLAEALDLTRLQPFELVEVDYEKILAEWIVELSSRLADAGVDYDVGGLETDPLAIFAQEAAYRELLSRQAINDAGQGLTLAKARGAVLDHLAATLFPTVGPRRMAGEDDPRFQRRIALAAEASSAGTLGGYEYRALTAHIGVRDALALNHASGLVPPGEIRLQILAETGQNQDEVLSAVRAAVLDREVALGTDTLSIVLSTPVTYDVTATIYIPRGPDPSLVLDEIRGRLAAYADERRRPGRVVALSGLDAALHAPSVERVARAAPIADVDPGLAGVAVIGQINLQMETPLA